MRPPEVNWSNILLKKQELAVKDHEPHVENSTKMNCSLPRSITPTILAFLDRKTIMMCMAVLSTTFQEDTHRFLFDGEAKMTLMGIFLQYFHKHTPLNNTSNSCKSVAIAEDMSQLIMQQFLMTIVMASQDSFKTSTLPDHEKQSFIVNLLVNWLTPERQLTQDDPGIDAQNIRAIVTDWLQTLWQLRVDRRQTMLAAAENPLPVQMIDAFPSSPTRVDQLRHAILIEISQTLPRATCHFIAKFLDPEDPKHVEIAADLAKNIIENAACELTHFKLLVTFYGDSDDLFALCLKYGTAKQLGWLVCAQEQLVGFKSGSQHFYALVLSDFTLALHVLNTISDHSFSNSCACVAYVLFKNATGDGKERISNEVAVKLLEAIVGCRTFKISLAMNLRYMEALSYYQGDFIYQYFNNEGNQQQLLLHILGQVRLQHHSRALRYLSEFQFDSDHPIEVSVMTYIFKESLKHVILSSRPKVAENMTIMLYDELIKSVNVSEFITRQNRADFVAMMINRGHTLNDSQDINTAQLGEALTRMTPVQLKQFLTLKNPDTGNNGLADIVEAIFHRHVELYDTDPHHRFPHLHEQFMMIMQTIKQKLPERDIDKLMNAKAHEGQSPKSMVKTLQQRSTCARISHCISELCGMVFCCPCLTIQCFRQLYQPQDDSGSLALQTRPHP